MAAVVVRRTEAGFVLQLEVPSSDSMHEAEDPIQAALNDAVARAGHAAAVRLGDALEGAWGRLGRIL